MATCPDCDGEKQSFAFLNRGPDWRTHTQEWVPCNYCKGAGTVDDAIIARRAFGRARRDERVAQRVTLMEASKSAGISPAELSAFERGLGPAYLYP